MVDYKIQMPDLMRRGMESYILAQQAQKRQMEIGEEQRKQQEQQRLRQKLMEFTNRRNKTAQDYIDLVEQEPMLYDAVKQPMSMLSEQEKENEILNAGQIYMLSKSKKKDLLLGRLQQYRDAYKNSGDDEKAQYYDMMIQQIDSGDDIGMQSAEESSAFLLGVMDPDRFRRMIDQGGKTRTQSSEILEDGTTIQVQSNGDVIVKDASNNVLTGEAARKAITQAKQYGSDLAKEINWNRETGKLEAQEELKATVEEKVTQAKTQAKSQEEREQGYIDQGLSAADSIPTLKRSIDLLKSVKTGGISGALIRAENLFGIQAADKGELTYNLSKNVLSQLKTTFGAQFTEREGAWLNRIESGIGRNNATNMAILSQALKRAKRKAKKAMQVARAKGDMETVGELQDLMKLDLTPGAVVESPSRPEVIQNQQIELTPGEQTATNPQTGEKIVFRNGQWLNINTGLPVK